jgi:FAD/FMN-containing dehydrogenase
MLPAMFAQAGSRIGKKLFRRVRPGDAAWPSAQKWQALQRDVGGRLVKVQSPLAQCGATPDSLACTGLMDKLKNPYYIRDEAGLTQALGWADAWTCEPSAYAIACESTQDVVAAVNFARTHKLRLVVKGGGHSYQGTSSAPDSLLIWTRKMNAIVMHEAFVAAGCAGKQSAVPAVTIDAGAIWMHAYDAVTTKAGRYIQGGGCATVGVAGLIQSGGFGSHSKRYGLAAASLLEAEIVTADGIVCTVNACSHPELFWALKGGGGGSLGVVTKVTLRTHDLPATFGLASIQVKAASDAAFQRLIEQVVGFYAENLFNPHWGEQIVFKTDNTLAINMSFQGLDKQQATALWQPLLDWLALAPQDYHLKSAPFIGALPSRMLWDAKFLKTVPGLVKVDGRPDAPEGNVFWSDGEKEAGKFVSGYQSTWLPASLLQADQRARLADALFASTRSWEMALHFNKGLAGAPPDAIKAAQDTATNPLVLDAFALAICAGEQSHVHPRMPGHQPDLPRARSDAQAIDASMKALRAVVPQVGSYVSESNYFEANWQQAFWGTNYARLLAAKRQYDPEGLFFVHHGVGSESWNADGFSRIG